jgi:hypothetical protein
MTMPSAADKLTILKVFGPPLLLAAISLFGLVAAFAFGAAGHVLSWLGVGAPIIVVAWFGLRAGR